MRVIIGLGNPILGDDGVGWRVAEEVEHRLARTHEDVHVERAAVGGLGLMERLVGCDCAVIVDAVHTGRRPTGAVMRTPLEALVDPSAGHTASVHDVSLATAMAAGRAVGAPLPSRVMIVGIETPRAMRLSETLSPAVEAAIPVAATLALDEALFSPRSPENWAHGVA